MKKHRIITFLAAILLIVLAFSLLPVSQAAAAPAAGEAMGGGDGAVTDPGHAGNPSNPPGPGGGQVSPGTGKG